MKKIILLLVPIFLLISCSSPEPEISFQIAKKFTNVRLDRIKRHANDKDAVVTKLKHLYIISSTTGKILIHSTVLGDVLSSKERIIPKALDSAGARTFPIEINKRLYYTTEIPNEDGSYGESDSYIYWWDITDTKHVHYITDGQIIHISERALKQKAVIEMDPVLPKKKKKK